MLDVRFVAENLEAVRASLETRGAAGSLGRIAELSEERRSGITELETSRARKNAASSEMAKLDKKGSEFAARRDELKTLGQRIKALEKRSKEVEAELGELVLHVPNLPDESTPVGANEEGNVVRSVFGDKPVFDFTPQEHIEIAVGLGIADFGRAAKVSGARFTVLRGAGSRLERGLIQLMMDLHADEHGYTELWPPALIRASALRGTGQLPKFAKDVFRIAEWDGGREEASAEPLYLSPTAEVQVTNFHADEIFEAGELPRAYCAYTACFRSEAGSYGKDTRGLIRQHQFDKVELVRFCEEGQGLAQLELLTGHAEKVLQRLGLHYRKVELCTGDLGFAAKKCFDLEVWLPGQDAYREISSCSWFGDFQARRAKIRYRPDSGAKPRLAHTLNGSGLAVGRTLVAILEQNQRADGTVRVPEALRPYVGGRDVIAKP